MQNFVYVFLGSGIGGCIRYSISLLLHKYHFNLPIHTITSNVLACFIQGMTMNYLSRQSNNDHLQYLIAIGICGGMSTYSTFSYELVQQINSGSWGLMILYALGTFALCLIAILVGPRVSL